MRKAPKRTAGEAPHPEPAPAPRCPVCSCEMSGQRCARCEASAKLQKAYLETGGIESRGINVGEAVDLLRRAQELLEENDPAGVEDFIQGALRTAAEAETLQGPLRKALDKAGGALNALKRSGRDTHRLEQAIRRAEKFLEDGELEGARLLVRRIPAFIRELQGPPVVAQERRSEPHYLSSCPKCSKHVMRSWRKCPHCLSPLQDNAGRADS